LAIGRAWPATSTHVGPAPLGERVWDRVVPEADLPAMPLGQRIDSLLEELRTPGSTPLAGFRRHGRPRHR
jgi:hypothetical protein